MIVSHTNQFIFVRTRKTASTSTEIVLGSWCGEGDIVTPVGPVDEITRTKFGGLPRNFCTDRKLEWEYRKALSSNNVDFIDLKYRQVKRHLAYENHASASDIKETVSNSIWSRYFKFAFDRHPYEKVVSIAFWRKKREIEVGADVNDFLDEVIEAGEYRNYDLYSESGEVCVDKVFKYESLRDELRKLALSFKKVIPDDLPNAKSQHRKDIRPASELLSDSQKKRIYEKCFEEFKLLKYDR